MNNHITEATTVLNQGGIVIFPTDTAFGIGCLANNILAIEKIFSIRQRPHTQAAPVLFDTVSRVREYVTHIPETVERELMEKYWPGALTVILPAKLTKMPSLVRGGGLTIGTRIPAHEIPRLLVQKTGVPLLGPSANFHGKPTPYRLADIDPSLIALVDYIVPGTTTVMRESTVIDCSETPWEIKRQGALEVTLGKELV